MKKIFLLVLISSVLVACNYTDAKSEKKTKQELVDNVRFKIFPTENIWNFLKLDTKSGKIWQVQYSVNEDYRGETELNDKALVSGDDAENGRFTLYPTKICTTSYFLTKSMVRCGRCNGLLMKKTE